MARSKTQSTLSIFFFLQMGSRQLVYIDGLQQDSEHSIRSERGIYVSDHSLPDSREGVLFSHVPGEGIRSGTDTALSPSNPIYSPSAYLDHIHCNDIHTYTAVAPPKLVRCTVNDLLRRLPKQTRKNLKSLLLFFIIFYTVGTASSPATTNKIKISKVSAPSISPT